MSTENETWRDASSAEENSGAGRDGNQFNKEGGYSRPSYNRDNGDRPYRPRFNSENGDRPQRPYNSDRPYRPRFNPGADNGDRPQRPRYNNDNGDRPYRPRFNSEGGDRPQRSYNNDRSYRPRYNSEGGDRPQRSYGNNAGSGLLNASQYLEHGGLTGTILADKSYTVFLIDNIRDVFEQRSGIKFYLQSFYRYHSVNEFIVQDCKGSDFQRYTISYAHIITSNIQEREHYSRISCGRTIAKRLPLPRVEATSIFP